MLEDIYRILKEIGEIFKETNVIAKNTQEKLRDDF